MIAFKMLANPQLSVRDNAVKMFSSYLNRSPLEEVQNVLLATMDKLNASKSASQVRSVVLGHNADSTVPIASSSWMDAYEAEGLLNLCAALVKSIPTDFFFCHSEKAITTFGFCLAHPASTVRQMSSMVFKEIMIKEAGPDPSSASAAASPTSTEEVNASRANLSPRPLLRLFLEPLIFSWSVDEMELMGFASYDTKLLKKVCGNLDLSILTPMDGCSSWQWKEGRLLTYELVIHFLMSEHLECLRSAITSSISGQSRRRSSSLQKKEATQVCTPPHILAPGTPESNPSNVLKSPQRKSQTRSPPPPSFVRILLTASHLL
jgi:hypothetical protein